MMPATCAHPLVDHVKADDTAKCRTCPQRFGLCQRHGMYPLVDAAGCPKCLPIGLGREKVEASK
jgi:hypothetical protein